MPDRVGGEVPNMPGCVGTARDPVSDVASGRVFRTADADRGSGTATKL